MGWLPHVRITARFNLGQGTTESENASCTLNFEAGANLVALENVRQIIVNNAFNAWAAYTENANGKIANSVRLMECRLYVMDSTGHASHPPAISEGAPIKGVGAGSQHPYQISNVLTLVASPGGKGRFGRIYLPPQNFGVQDGSGISEPSHVTAMSTAAFNFLNDISNLPGIDAGWGLRIAGTTGAGTLREVQEVRFGRVADTQRRRRRNLEEQYITADFSA